MAKPTLPKLHLSAFRRVSIGARLWLGFSMLLMFLAGLAGLGVWQTAKLGHRMHVLVEEDARITALTSDLQFLVKDMVVSLSNMCLLEEEADLRDVKERFQQQLTQYDGTRSELLKRSEGHVDVARALKELSFAEGSARATFSAMAGQSGSNDRAQLIDFYYTQTETAQRDWLRGLGEMKTRVSAAMVVAAASAQAEVARARVVTLVLGVAAMVVGFGAAALILRSIQQPLRQAVAMADAVAGGDLTVTVETDRTDEIGRLLNALRSMRDGLGSLVGGVRRCSEGISVASSEVASGNSDLSHRTEVTAGSLQQTAASLEHLTQVVRENADAANSAQQLATNAGATARRGGAVVAQVVESMESITRTSEKIADIIGMIDGIAFQTNLLALNAAVEAARAGDQGRGFAVVANEVRALAQRSAGAAREIKTLIGTSADAVSNGRQLVLAAGATMHEIESAVKQVTEVVSEIDASMREQCTGLVEVNEAVSRLDDMTQQNAALVEQSAAASESLREQARRLDGMMGAFRLESIAI